MSFQPNIVFEEEPLPRLSSTSSDERVEDSLPNLSLSLSTIDEVSERDLEAFATALEAGRFLHQPRLEQATQPSIGQSVTSVTNEAPAGNNANLAFPNISPGYAPWLGQATQSSSGQSVTSAQNVTYEAPAESNPNPAFPQVSSAFQPWLRNAAQSSIEQSLSVTSVQNVISSINAPRLEQPPATENITTIPKAPFRPWMSSKSNDNPMANSMAPVITQSSSDSPLNAASTITESERDANANTQLPQRLSSARHGAIPKVAGGLSTISKTSESRHEEDNMQARSVTLAKVKMEKQKWRPTKQPIGCEPIFITLDDPDPNFQGISENFVTLQSKEAREEMIRIKPGSIIPSRRTDSLDECRARNKSNYTLNSNEIAKPTLVNNKKKINFASEERDDFCKVAINNILCQAFSPEENKELLTTLCKSVAKDTLIFRGEKVPQFNQNEMQTDTFTKEKIYQRQKWKDNNYIPTFIYGDGNCLYTSFAVALFNDKTLHREARLSTLVNLVLQEDKIQGIMNERGCGYQFKLKEEMAVAGFDGEWASMPQLIALTIGLGVKTFTHYPSMNGEADIMPQVYTGLIDGCPENPNSPMIEIIFSRCGPMEKGDWMSNHFCPLLPQNPRLIKDDMASKEAVQPIEEETSVQTDMNGNSQVPTSSSCGSTLNSPAKLTERVTDFPSASKVTESVTDFPSASSFVSQFEEALNPIEEGNTNHADMNANAQPTTSSACHGAIPKATRRVSTTSNVSDNEVDLPDLSDISMGTNSEAETSNAIIVQEGNVNPVVEAETAHAVIVQDCDFDPNALEPNYESEDEPNHESEDEANIPPIEDENAKPNPVEDRFPNMKRKKTNPDTVEAMVKKARNPDFRQSMEVHDSIPNGRKTNISLMTKHPCPEKNETDEPFDHPSDDKSTYDNQTTKFAVYESGDQKVPKRPDVKFDYGQQKFIKDGAAMSEEESRNLIAVMTTYHYRFGKENFSRRVTYFRRVPENLKFLQDVAFVDYKGQDIDLGSSLQVHRNSKQNNHPYHKSDKRMAKEVRETFIKNPKANVRDVYAQFHNEKDFKQGPRDRPQLSYLKATANGPREMNR